MSKGTKERTGYTTVSMSDEAHEELQEMSNELGWPQRRIISTALRIFRGSLRYNKMASLSAELSELEKGGVV